MLGTASPQFVCWTFRNTSSIMSDWHTLFLGADNTWLFVLECAMRAVIMFVAVLFLFKLTGKREVRQFSVLELIVVIGLGSALGDAMIYTDSPILPSVVAMLVVLLCYWIMNKWMNHSRSLEKLIEGEVIRVFANGVVDTAALKKEGMTVHEFYGELRVHHVEQLGQVKSAYVEIDGELSVFFLPDEEVGYGLPIAPEFLRSQEGITDGQVACCGCGTLKEQPFLGMNCERCGAGRWVRTSNAKRIG